MINLLKDKKAVSPVIAVLLMVAIAVVAALITYSWVTGFVTTTTTKAGHAIQIQGVSFDTTDDEVTVYVQNVGEGTVKITGTLFINGIGFSNSTSFNEYTLSEGSIAKFVVDTTGTIDITSGTTYTIRVVCTDGTFTEGKYTA